MKKPKVKTQSIVRAKNLNKTVNNAKKHTEIKENNETEYSANRFEEIAKDTAKTGVEVAYRGARAGYQKAKQSTNRNNNSYKSNEKQVAIQNDNSYKLNEKQYDIKSKPIVPSKQKEQASNIKSKQAVISKQKVDTVSYKSKVNANIELAKRKAHVKSAKKQAKIKDIKIKSAVTSPKNAIFTGEKNPVKVSTKGVKQSTKAVKPSAKGIKTAKATTKTVYKSAKASAIASKKAKMVAKQTAVATKQAAVFSYKAVKAAIKAMIEAIQGVIALVAAGGWVAVLILVIVGAFGVILASPFGLFFNEGDDEHPSISQVVTLLNAEYTAEINRIIFEAGEVDEVNFDGESDSAIYAPPNWIDILAIFSVKYTITDTDEEYMDMLLMDSRKINALTDIFWSMNSIDYQIIESEPEPTPTPSPEPEEEPEEQEPIRTLVITTSYKNHIEARDMYRFNNKQNDMLDELLSGEYHSLFMEIIGMDSFYGLTPEQVANLVNDLPVGTKGSEIVRFALSRLGDPYSQSLRGQGNYVDCSYLTRWCYLQAGVSHFTAGTAASQAEYCVNNGLTIAKSDLQAGDLVYWSHKVNGRFMNITHTGVYAGDGMVIDASFSRGMVVYRPLFDHDKQVVYARPHVY